MPTANELMERLHRIREADAEGSSGMLPDEYLRQLERRVEGIRRRLGLRPAEGAPRDDDANANRTGQ